jgi:hypothetical protein
MVLQHQKLAIYTATSGKEAQAIMNEVPIELMQWTKSNYPNTTIIAATGQEELKEEAVWFDAVYVKPLIELVEIIEAHLE